MARVHALDLQDSCTDLHDTASALDLARRAVADDATDSLRQETLGAAAYRNGSYQEARDALLAAAKLSPNPSRNVELSFLLAMVLDELGDRDDARQWYDRGVARMDESYPRKPSLVALKREATALLDGGALAGYKKR